MNTRSGSLLLVFFFGVALCIAAAVEANPTCAAMAPGGEVVVTRFLAAPLPRAREILADAMQADGVVLYKNTEESIEGERVHERVKVLRLPSGDEAIRATLTPATEDGKPGTRVQVETMRPSFKKGAPGKSWSSAVMNQASCLMTLLSVDDPLRRPMLPATGGKEILIPTSTPLLVRSRRFFFNTEVKIGQTLPFETVAPVVLDGETVIPSGAPVLATMQQLSDSKSFGRAAKGELVFKYVILPDGSRLALRGTVDFSGKNTHTQGIAAEAATLAITGTAVAFGGGGPLAATALADPGLGFAVPAGSVLTVELAADAKVQVASSNIPTKAAQ